MAKHYRAKVASVGFRGKYWEADEIAENVTPEEEKLPAVKAHFVHVPNHVAQEPASGNESGEPETLAELQAVQAGKPLKSKK